MVQSSHAKGTKSTSLWNEVDLVPFACEDGGLVLIAYVSSETSGEPVHMHILIGAFTAHRHIVGP